MKNILEKLIDVLQSEDKFISEEKLLKNKIIESALSLDPLLIKLLLKDEAIKKIFFENIDDILVFDKIKFQRFVSNKQFLPDSYTSFSNKIGLTKDSEFIQSTKDVVLSWTYKDCVLEGGQDKDDAKRNEIFWNETLAPDQIDRLLSPKVLTNFKKIAKDSESAPNEITENDNLIIKGNNLLALHTLLKKYRQKVKLIYIDPPYNTGSDSWHSPNIVDTFHNAI
jgi:adenine-specific DNA-methyltransferase